jgi:FADH2 O2-dependent halogenase
MATGRCDVAIVGSGFTGSLLARILAKLGRSVVLLERGTHPRFAIGESTTPLANLSLERIARRYGLQDCFQLAAHGRWIKHLPHVRRGLKRGFTFYRHHANEPFRNAGLDSERLMVAASPNAHVADTQWVRADVDHHLVRAAIEAGVDYRDRAELTSCEITADRAKLGGRRDGMEFGIDAGFVIDASGPGGFLAKRLDIPDALNRTHTRSGLVFSHFADVPLMHSVVGALPDGPYPDDWAAVHHIIDEGWMYSLRFDDGTVSAGFVIRGDGTQSAGGTEAPERIWWRLLDRYPTLGDVFGGAKPLMPMKYVPRIQHRLATATGARWALMPHTFAFVDPLYSTGIAWGLRAVERLAFAFESNGTPRAEDLARYDDLLRREGDQIDHLVAGSYHAMMHFDVFAAQALIYFATVSHAETRQRVAPSDDVAWSGFLGVGDEALDAVPRESHERLGRLTQGGRRAATHDERREFVEWASAAIAPRNIAGFADPARHNLYPIDLDVLLDRHQLLGLERDQLVAALPTLRGMAPEPAFE